MNVDSCRSHFSPADINFVVKSVSNNDDDRQSAFKLFSDGDCRDIMLDSSDLLGALTDEDDTVLQTSLDLYFYVVVRSLLMDYGIDDRDVADYVANVLSKHSSQELGATYLMDFIEKEQNVRSESEMFCFTNEKADCMLVLTGMFPSFLERRSASHGAPGIDFYEKIGATTYSSLSKHRMVTRTLSRSFEIIGNDFHRIRSSLNCIMLG